MKLDEKGFNLLVELEGLILHPYQDKKGIWTIGVGNTYYEDGTPVKQHDTAITKERAYGLFEHVAIGFESSINKVIPSDLNQNQYNSLFCFAWNVGKTGFLNSTLLRKIKVNPNDIGGITQAFLMWKGKDNSLYTRRKKEIQNYFA